MIQQGRPSKYFYEHYFALIWHRLSISILFSSFSEVMSCLFICNIFFVSSFCLSFCFYALILGRWTMSTCWMRVLIESVSCVAQKNSSSRSAETGNPVCLLCRLSVVSCWMCQRCFGQADGSGWPPVQLSVNPTSTVADVLLAGADMDWEPPWGVVSHGRVQPLCVVGKESVVGGIQALGGSHFGGAWWAWLG